MVGNCVFIGFALRVSKTRYILLVLFHGNKYKKAPSSIRRRSYKLRGTTPIDSKLSAFNISLEILPL